MSRISFAVLTIALLFSNVPALVAQDSPPDEAAWSKAVNLLALIDPNKDTVAGKWTIQDGKLMAESTMRSRLQIPFAPPKDYDFRIVFSRPEKTDIIGQMLSRGDSVVMWVITCSKGSPLGFGMVSGMSARSNTTTVRNDSGLEPGRPHASILQIRRKGAKAFLNGKLVCQWKTNWTDASLHTEWDIPNHRLLGLGTSGPAIFHKVDLIEVIGKGTPSRRK